MPLNEAVAFWVRAQYYMRRPWMHPRRGETEPGYLHVPVTQDLILAEDTLLRAFLETSAYPDKDLDLYAALKAEAAMWHDDLVELGIKRGEKTGVPPGRPMPDGRKKKRVPRVIPQAPDETPPRRRPRNLFSRG